MARLAQIDSQIRANRLILANRFRVPELNPFFLRIAPWGAKKCESQVWDDSRESLARCENPTVPEGHKHRVTTPETLGKSPADPRRAPQRPRRTLGRDPAEPSERPPEPFERQISSESLAEGCAPRMVTLRNFKTGNSSTWRAQKTAENRRFSQKTAGNHRLGSVTLGPSRFSSALKLCKTKSLELPFLRCLS